MPLASRKDKHGLFTFLYFRAQQGLDVFFAVFHDLLKFVDGDDARFIGSFQIGENLIKRGLWLFDFADSNVESRFASHGIEFEAWSQRCHDLEEFFRPLGAKRFQLLVNGVSKQIGKL